jgi:hypothetical protein
MAECCKGSFSLLLSSRKHAADSDYINGTIEFVLAIASEANEICEKEAKKTLMPEHIVAALKVNSFSQSSAVTSERLTDEMDELSHWDSMIWSRK